MDHCGEITAFLEMVRYAHPTNDTQWRGCVICICVGTMQSEDESAKTVRNSSAPNNDVSWRMDVVYLVHRVLDQRFETVGEHGVRDLVMHKNQLSVARSLSMADRMLEAWFEVHPSTRLPSMTDLERMNMSEMVVYKQLYCHDRQKLKDYKALFDALREIIGDVKTGQYPSESTIPEMRTLREIIRVLMRPSETSTGWHYVPVPTPSNPTPDAISFETIYWDMIHEVFPLTQPSVSDLKKGQPVLRQICKIYGFTEAGLKEDRKLPTDQWRTNLMRYFGVRNDGSQETLQNETIVESGSGAERRESIGIASTPVDSRMQASMELRMPDPPVVDTPMADIPMADTSMADALETLARCSVSQVQSVQIATMQESIADIQMQDSSKAAAIAPMISGSQSLPATSNATVTMPMTPMEEVTGHVADSSTIVDSDTLEVNSNPLTAEFLQSQKGKQTKAYFQDLCTTRGIYYAKRWSADELIEALLGRKQGNRKRESTNSSQDTPKQKAPKKRKSDGSGLISDHDLEVERQLGIPVSTLKPHSSANSMRSEEASIQGDLHSVDQDSVQSSPTVDTAPLSSTPVRSVPLAKPRSILDMSESSHMRPNSSSASQVLNVRERAYEQLTPLHRTSVDRIVQAHVGREYLVAIQSTEGQNYYLHRLSGFIFERVPNQMFMIVSRMDPNTDRIRPLNKEDFRLARDLRFPIDPSIINLDSE